MSKNVAIKEALEFGWTAFRREWQFLLIAAVILYAISGSFNFLAEVSYKDIEPTSSLLKLISSLITAWLYLNILRALLGIADGHSPKLANLFIYDHSLITYVITSVLYGVIVGVGFFLFIIPGIYFSLRYGMYSYIIADRKLGIIESLKESARLTDGAKWQLFLMAIISILLVLAGLVALLVGVLVVLPVLGLAYVWIYRSLFAQSGSIAVRIPPVDTMVAMPAKPKVVTNK